MPQLVGQGSSGMISMVSFLATALNKALNFLTEAGWRCDLKRFFVCSL
jgi:hypothetical protein